MTDGDIGSETDAVHSGGKFEIVAKHACMLVAKSVASWTEYIFLQHLPVLWQEIGGNLCQLYISTGWIYPFQCDQSNNAKRPDRVSQRHKQNLADRQATVFLKGNLFASQEIYY
jgi:hypothetical protein